MAARSIKDPKSTQKRTIISALAFDELEALADILELDVEGRRSQSGLVDLLTRSRRADIHDIIDAMPRFKLVELCERFGIDVGDASDDALVAKLLRSSPHAAVTVDPERAEVTPCDNTQLQKPCPPQGGTHGVPPAGSESSAHEPAVAVAVDDAAKTHVQLPHLTIIRSSTTTAAETR